MSMSPRMRRGLIWLGAAVAVCGGGVAACVAILPIHTGPLFRGHAPSGHEWCRDQAANRPFVKTVNEGVIGGSAWPADKAFAFYFHLFRDDPKLGVNSGDYRTVSEALQSGTTDKKIAPGQARPAQAAAARLDHYCATH